MRHLFFVLSFVVSHHVLAFEQERAASADDRASPPRSPVSVVHRDIAHLPEGLLRTKLNGILGKGRLTDSDNLVFLSDIKTECRLPTATAQKQAAIYLDPVEIDGIPCTAEHPEIVIGEDLRQQVFHTKQWPFCAHGEVVATFNDGSHPWGTGVLIADKVVLTAAHVFYSHRSHEHPTRWATAVEFYPALNGQETLLYGSSLAQKWYFPKEYKERKEEDYAIAILEKGFGSTIGYLGLEVLPNERFEKADFECSLYGYPADRNEQTPRQQRMFGMSGRIDEVGEKNLQYGISTFGGQSGAPLFYPAATPLPEKEVLPKNQESKDKYHVVGVHVSGPGANGRYNIATRLTKDRLKRIDGWIKGAVEEEQITLATLPELRLPGGKGGVFNEEKLNDEAIEELLKLSLRVPTFLQALTFLDLTNHSMTKPAQNLCNLPNLTNLRVLKLGRNLLGEEAEEHNAIPILCSLNSLESLDISDSWLTEGDAKQLAQGRFRKLQKLYMGNIYAEGGRIGNEGVKAFAQAPWVSQLVTLDIKGSGIDDGGATALLDKMSQLEDLNISKNNLTSDVVQGLQKLPELKKLEISLRDAYLRNSHDFLGLFDMPSLTTLGLELEKNIESSDITCVITKLTTSPSIKEFYLKFPIVNKRTHNACENQLNEGLRSIDFEPAGKWFTRRQTTQQ